jgi:hypothetical protein
VVEKFSQQLHFVCVKWPKAGFHVISLRKRREKRAYVNASGSSPWVCTLNNLLEVYFHHALGQSVPARYHSTFSGNLLRLRLLFVGLPIAKFFRHFPVSEFFNSVGPGRWPGQNWKGTQSHNLLFLLNVTVSSLEATGVSSD